MAHHKPIIGLTGGIGSGKSWVARRMGEIGALVIDADALAHQALAEPAVLEQIVQWWGPKVVDANGSPDRPQIARIVFENPQELKRLEALIHPRVAGERERLIAAAEHDPKVLAVVLDIPLLLETGQAGLCDTVVFVEADRSLRLKRVAGERGWDEAELTRRESAQWPVEKKRQLADNVIENQSDEARCLSQVRDLLARILHPDSSRTDE